MGKERGTNYMLCVACRAVRVLRIGATRCVPAMPAALE